MKLVMALTAILSFYFLPANAETKLELVQKYLGDRFFKPAPKGEIFFVFKEGKLKRESKGQTYETLLFSNGFKNGPSAGLIKIIHNKTVVQPAVTKAPKSYAEPSTTTETKQKPSKRAKLQAEDKKDSAVTGPIKLDPISMIPDSVAQDSIKNKVIVSFTLFSTQMSAAASKVWDIITYIFTGLLLLFGVAIFFFRFVATSVAGEKPIKLLGLGVVSINRTMLKMFAWSSTIILVLSILVVGFFVLTVFFWICALGLPIWLTIISFFPAQWLGTKLVNWSVPDLEDDTQIMLLGGGHAHGPVQGH